MKTKAKMILLALVGMSFSVCFAGHFTFMGVPKRGVKYKFEVNAGVTDKWDSATSDQPPLTPGKAIRIATEFVKTGQVGDVEGWTLEGITLHRMSGRDEPEQWIYLVHFNGNRAHPLESTLLWVDIPVRFDGTVPRPTVTKSE